jgi:hypothetical protein
VYAYDKVLRKIVASVPLLELEKVINDKQLVLLAKENKYSFLEPGAPLWPVAYMYRNNEFVRISNVSDFYDFSALAVETLSFMRRYYLVCDRVIEGCYFEKEYIKGKSQLLNLLDYMGGQEK